MTPEDAREVRAAYDAQRDAMVAGDAEALAALLADGAVTVWEAEPVPVEVVARTTTDATIWGNRGTWRLELRTSYAFVGGAWKASRIIASIW